MNGQEVYEALLAKHICHLYHANSVTTSCTFLQQGALVSRGFAEANKLSQTKQYTDDSDKKYGVWHDVFLDSDDYHRRISDRNQYGPVVFVINSKILTMLPAGSQVLVTRSNPSKWLSGQSQDDRYYSTQDQLYEKLVLGTFDQMMTIRTLKGLLPFGQSLVEVVLDNPKQQRPDSMDTFTSSMTDLKKAASFGKVTAQLRGRACEFGCKCLNNYKSHWKQMQPYF